MEKPNFLKPKLDTRSIEELKGEQSYFDNIKEIENSGKLIKKIKEFSTAQEAQEYLQNQPQKENYLQRFLPRTNYIIGKFENSKCTVYAISETIAGNRLDKIDLNDQDDIFYEQLDDFLFSSLLLYENKKVCPGINLKNLVLDENGHLFYVDSEPYPPCNIEPFEMAYARKQKLLKIFGENLQKLLPKTYNWIKENEVENYKKAKGAAKRKRRKKIIISLDFTPI